MIKKLLLAGILLFGSSLAIAEDGNSLLGGEQDFAYKKKEFQEATIKKKLDYPAFVVVTFVDRCATSMMGYMPMHPTQSRPIAIQMCSCIMDQFRSDFDMDAFTKGGVKLAQAMGEQYSQVCKQLEFGEKRNL